MPHEIAGRATCVICGENFYGPPISLVIAPGQTNAANNRTAAYLQKLTEHLFKKHMPEVQAMMLRAAEFQGLLFLCNYQTEDAGLKEQREFLRWQIHQQTMNAHLPDEKIAEQSLVFAKQLLELFEANLGTVLPAGANYFLEQVRPGLLKIARDKVTELVRGLRDIFEEPGKFVVEAGAVLASPNGPRPPANPAG